MKRVFHKKNDWEPHWKYGANTPGKNGILKGRKKFPAIFHCVSLIWLAGRPGSCEDATVEGFCIKFAKIQPDHPLSVGPIYNERNFILRNGE
jgi:hypothetical protein